MKEEIFVNASDWVFVYRELEDIEAFFLNFSLPKFEVLKQL